MTNKTLIALSAMALLGTVSAASAYEAPENKLGDRFPFLERTYAPVAVKSTGIKMTTARRIASRSQDEVPEHKAGDRFAFLDAGYAPIASGASNRAVRVIPIQTTYEAPEHKIGDRFPLLERAYAQLPTRTVAVAARMQKFAKKF
jgi:hypothetical protein